MTVGALDSSEETEYVTKMEPYSVHWAPPSSSWNSREISVLLPSGTQYSRGIIKIPTENGYTSRQDLVDASSGIPVSRSGKVALAVTCKIRKVVGDEVITHKEFQMATLSLSLLEKGRPKSEYLDQLKKKSVEVLSQTDSSVITRVKNARFHFYDDIEKTVISGDLVLQIRCGTFGSKEPILSNPFYRMFEKIAFVP